MSERVVTLRRKDKASPFWVGLCPWHPPAVHQLHVREGHSEFHCFACGASGMVVRLNRFEDVAVAVVKKTRHEEVR